MKCTSKFFKKIKCIGALVMVLILTTACGSQVKNAYDTYSTDFLYGNTNTDFFAKDLCVINNVNFGQDQVDDNLAEAAGVFNLDKKEVTYNQNIFEKKYPASTTKILTAYIIIKNCNLDDLVTVSDTAANPGQSSSVCGLNAGDTASVKTLLYGLLLKSGNDAAIALAEFYAGSSEAFAEIMNQEALKMGATGSHFTNPSGLPDENHYTTVYDMYLISAQALQLNAFTEIINCDKMDVSYTDKNGNAVNATFTNSCKYLSGGVDVPEGFNIIGGKTGTTYDAGLCLVLFSTNANNERIISIVYKAAGKSDLYQYMNQILTTFGN